MSITQRLGKKTIYGWTRDKEVRVTPILMTTLDLAFSTCPNDTFIFHAMLHHCIDTGELGFIPHMHDIDTLNKK